MSRIKILTVVSARSQFVKASVVFKYLRDNKDTHSLTEVLVHTGQHYDQMMNDVFFKEFDMQVPNYSLDVGSGSPGKQIARMLERLEPVIKEESPDVLLVYGDTNSTIATTLLGAHHNIPVVHVEAGERIYRRHEVQEEINRILTDHISSLNLTSTRRACDYLEREGISPQRIKFVGDTMYELFIWALDNVNRLSKVTHESFGLDQGKYHIATIHKVQNTNSKESLLRILYALDNANFPVVLPLHSRLANLIAKWEYKPIKSLMLIEPLGYFDFIRMLIDCSKVITDSGGVTREAFFARKPCIVLMENSMWTEITESGWSICVGTEGEMITKSINTFTPTNEYPENLFGDGKSARHIIDEITVFIKSTKKRVHWHKHGSFEALPQSQSTDFTYSNYVNMVRLLQEAGYCFEKFGNSLQLLEKSQQFILMRHDIDLDLHKALTLAEIEADIDITSTYFVMVRNDFYNCFSKEGTAIVMKILEMGHSLGLHFDCAAYPDKCTKEEIAKACANEVKYLEDWFNHSIEIVSFHRPNQLILKGDPEVSAPLPHTYQQHFTSDIKYCSDSTGKWRYGSPLEQEAFVQKRPLHILVHPIWWNESPTANYPTLLKFVDEKMRKVEASLSNNCTVFRIDNH